MPTPDSTSPERLYAAAYAAHYSGRDIKEAVAGYTQAVERYPESPEAGYARAQILNILTSMVPPDKVFAAHLKLIAGELEAL